MKFQILKTFAFLLIASFVLTFSVSAQTTKDTKVCKLQTKACCEMCKTKLETGMKSQDGVLESTVDMKDKMMTVKFDPSKTSEDKIKTALAKLDVPMTSKDAKSDDCCKDKSKCSTKDAKGVKDAKDVKASKDAMDVKCTKDTKCSAPEMEKSTDVKK